MTFPKRRNYGGNKKISDYGKTGRVEMNRQNTRVVLGQWKYSVDYTNTFIIHLSPTMYNTKSDP